MLNILFISADFNIGGAEKCLAELIFRIDRKSFRPVVCSLYGLGSLKEGFVEQEIVIYENLFKTKFDPMGILRLVRVIYKEKTDIVYLNNQPATQFWGVLAAKITQVSPIISALHFTQRKKRARRSRFVNKFMSTWTDGFIAISKAQKEYVSRREKIDPEKIAVIANGVDVEGFNKAHTNLELQKKLLKLPRDSKIIGIVAQLRPEKNHQLFLQAAKIISGQSLRAYFLVIGDGPERRALEDQAKKLGIDDRVYFLGLRNDVPDLINVCDLGVICSKFESFPLSVLEFMAAGKPVVATRVGSLDDIVIDGQTGLLVDEGDVAGLVQGILDILGNASLARAMGVAAKQRVKECFTIQRMVHETETLLLRSHEQ